MYMYAYGLTSKSDSMLAHICALRYAVCGICGIIYVVAVFWCFRLGFRLGKCYFRLFRLG